MIFLLHAFIIIAGIAVAVTRSIPPPIFHHPRRAILRPRPLPHHNRPLIHEPVAIPGVARIRGGGCADGDTAGCRIQGREGLIDYAATIAVTRSIPTPISHHPRRALLRPRPHQHYHRPLVHEPVAVPGVAWIRGSGCDDGDTASCCIQGREGLIDYAATIAVDGGYYGMINSMTQNEISR